MEPPATSQLREAAREQPQLSWEPGDPELAAFWLAAQLMEDSSPHPRFCLAGEKGNELQGQHEVS